MTGVSMEAVYNDFAKEDIFNTISQKSKAAMSNCWMLLDPKSTNDINNTDIVIWINELHKSLEDDQEVGIKIDHQGNQVVFYIDHIAHQNKAMIYFKGHTENGKIVHFVKHSSELSIELQALKRRCTDIPKTPFGFDDWNDYDMVKRING